MLLFCSCLCLFKYDVGSKKRPNNLNINHFQNLGYGLFSASCVRFVSLKLKMPKTSLQKKAESSEHALIPIRRERRINHPSHMGVV